ncbi:hypothetical protein D9M73_146680 [compost metagenome]
MAKEARQQPGQQADQDQAYQQARPAWAPELEGHTDHYGGQAQQQGRQVDLACVAGQVLHGLQRGGLAGQGHAQQVR